VWSGRVPGLKPEGYVGGGRVATSFRLVRCACSTLTPVRRLASQRRIEEHLTPKMRGLPGWNAPGLSDNCGRFRCLPSVRVLSGWICRNDRSRQPRSSHHRRIDQDDVDSGTRPHQVLAIRSPPGRSRSRTKPARPGFGLYRDLTAAVVRCTSKLQRPTADQVKNDVRMRCTGMVAADGRDKG
jgi:hypothetical protein